LTWKSVEKGVGALGTTLAPLRDNRASGCIGRVDRHENSSKRGDIMRKLTAGMVGLAVLVLGAGLAPSPALAKCSKDCKVQIRTQDKACRSACAKHDKTCKKGCTTAKKAAKSACKAATNPAPPTCSPSGAFLP
jgi:hypothetical protein